MSSSTLHKFSCASLTASSISRTSVALSFDPNLSACEAHRMCQSLARFGKRCRTLHTELAQPGWKRSCRSHVLVVRQLRWAPGCTSAHCMCQSPKEVAPRASIPAQGVSPLPVRDTRCRPMLSRPHTRVEAPSEGRASLPPLLPALANANFPPRPVPTLWFLGESGDRKNNRSRTKQ